ncbi:MAG: hypothetical protein KKD38_06360 [Candidatus Delongbacteria bacterium]|nr:hypothetical protein [Candidatus Delongbacteria bacterium]
MDLCIRIFYFLLLTITLTGCNPDTDNHFRDEQNIKNVSSPPIGFEADNNYKPEMNNINFQLYQNLFDDFAYYSKVISDNEFPYEKRRKALNLMYSLFDQKASIKDYADGSIYGLSLSDYISGSLNKNEKCFFTNIDHEFDMINDKPVIIYKTDKLLYYPIGGSKFILTMRIVISISNETEPQITGIEIDDVEESY